MVPALICRSFKQAGGALRQTGNLGLADDLRGITPRGAGNPPPPPNLVQRFTMHQDCKNDNCPIVHGFLHLDYSTLSNHRLYDP